jgi:hypothetical protein
MGSNTCSTGTGNVVVSMEAAKWDIGTEGGDRATNSIQLGCGVHRFLIGKVEVLLPEWLPVHGWSIQTKGYITFSSRGIKYGIRRGTYAHRKVMEKLLGRQLTEDEIVHHQNFNKGDCRPCNLLLLSSALFNPSPARRCPYTGRFMNPETWQRIYGKYEPPEWVTRNDCNTD